MKAKTLFFLTVTCICILNLSCAQNKEEIDFKLNPTIGEERNYVYSTKTEGSTAKMDTEIELSFKVLSNKSGVIEYEVNVISIVSETSLFGEPESYDSRKEVASMNESELTKHADFKNLLDSTLLISMDSRGRIVKKLSFPNGERALNLPIDFNYFQMLFPDEKIKEGSSWENEWTNMVLRGKMIEADYEVLKITEETVQISSKLKIPAASVLLDPTISRGKYSFERSTGLLINGSLKQKLIMGGKLKISFAQKD